jgi:hypothetical protein
VEELKDIVTNIGAFAGFAAIVGLAVLAMLYFSQARDVRRLREWAGRAPERDAEVQQMAEQLASQAIADMWAAMPESEPQPEPALPPEMPAVVSEAGTSEAEAGEPASADEWSPEQPPLEPVPDVDEEPAEAAAEAAAHEDVEPAAAGSETAEGDEAAEPEPAPEQALHAAVGQPTEEVNVLELADEQPSPTETRPSRLAPSTPAAARAGRAPAPPGATGPRLPLPPLDEYRSTAAESIGAGVYTATGHTSETTFSDFERERNRAERRASGTRAPFYVAGALVLAFGVLLVYTQIGGDTGGEKAGTAKQSEADRRKATGSNPRINRPAVQVVVLNGTQISGLAAVVGDQVDQAGFTLKSVANRGGDQDQIDSVVYYAPGKKLEAEEVAKELQIDTVKEVDADTAAAGGNAPVIVVTGSDREQ